ncbi:hypothetical protein [Tenacibaculum xiamenense]|uniref:hypothetical protein n=1 Tax=Tenacibaculum xiamenense TaxID=1261553 RepID=UPI00389449BD
MEQAIATNRFIIILLTFIVSITSYSQNKNDFYTLFKDGKKYKKIVGNIMLDNKVRVVNKNKNTVVYYFNHSMLEHRKEEHVVKLCNSECIDKLKLTTLEKLGEIKEEEINKRLKEEGVVVYPRPLNNKILKLFLIEPMEDGNFRKIEVEWIYVLK